MWVKQRADKQDGERCNFLRYVRITKEENARMLADNEFFK